MGAEQIFARFGVIPAIIAGPFFGLANRQGMGRLNGALLQPVVVVNNATAADSCKTQLLLLYLKKSILDATMEELGMLEQRLMLAILGLYPAAYGVALQKELKARTGREYSVGTIYAALDRLEDNGFVQCKQGEATAERGGRAKLYFSLTAPGHAALEASLNVLDRLRANTRFATVTP